MSLDCPAGRTFVVSNGCSWAVCIGAAGVPVALAEGSLSPLEFAAITRTVYSPPPVNPLRVSMYRSPAGVDWSISMLVAGSLVSCRDASNSSLPDLHWILKEVVDVSAEDQRTSSSVVRTL